MLCHKVAGGLAVTAYNGKHEAQEKMCQAAARYTTRGLPCAVCGIASCISVCQHVQTKPDYTAASDGEAVATRVYPVRWERPSSSHVQRQRVAAMCHFRNSCPVLTQMSDSPHQASGRLGHQAGEGGAGRQAAAAVDQRQERVGRQIGAWVGVVEVARKVGLRPRDRSAQQIQVVAATPLHAPYDTRCMLRGMQAGPSAHVDLELTPSYVIRNCFVPAAR
jgi:hypothetical protein